jgi:hypothetical protein
MQFDCQSAAEPNGLVTHRVATKIPMTVDAPSGKSFVRLMLTCYANEENQCGVGSKSRGYCLGGYGQKHARRGLSNIFDKLGVSTRLELALFAVNQRLPLKGIP